MPANRMKYLFISRFHNKDSSIYLPQAHEPLNCSKRHRLSFSGTFWGKILFDLIHLPSDSKAQMLVEEMANTY